MGRQEIQNESHESSESSYFPSSSCYPCGPHSWPASVQRRSIFLLLQQQWQLCQQEHEQTNLRRCRREVLPGWRHTLLDRQPSPGRRHRGPWSWCLGSRCSRSSMGPNRARASTPVEGGRGKPTLEEAPPLEGLEGKTLTARSGSSCPPARGAPATMAGGGGKHLERTSLEQGSLAVSLVAPLTVAAAVTTASLSIITVSTATSRTREDSTTRVLTARALTRTRASTTRTTESANATTA